MTDPNLSSNERTTKALKACAEWLSECLRIGWDKSALDRLEAIWWEFHDDQGRLRQSPNETPARRPSMLTVERGMAKIVVLEGIYPDGDYEITLRPSKKASACTGCNSTPCVCAELRSAQNGNADA